MINKMKTVLLIFSIVVLSTSLTYGQFYPVDTLIASGSYQLNNYDCPQFNCFELAWSAPPISVDTLVAYNMYENDTLYMTFPATTLSFGCPGFPLPGCGMNS